MRHEPGVIQVKGDMINEFSETLSPEIVPSKADAEKERAIESSVDVLATMVDNLETFRKELASAGLPEEEVAKISADFDRAIQGAGNILLKKLEAPKDEAQLAREVEESARERQAWEDERPADAVQLNIQIPEGLIEKSQEQAKLLEGLRKAVTLREIKQALIEFDKKKLFIPGKEKDVDPSVVLLAIKRIYDLAINQYPSASDATEYEDGLGYITSTEDLRNKVDKSVLPIFTAYRLLRGRVSTDEVIESLAVLQKEGEILRPHELGITYYPDNMLEAVSSAHRAQTHEELVEAVKRIPTIFDLDVKVYANERKRLGLKAMLASVPDSVKARWNQYK